MVVAGVTVEGAAYPRIQLEDVQGLILRGYGHLRHSAFVTLRLRDREAGRAWLGMVRGLVTTAAHSRHAPVSAGTGHHIAVNLAFTASGLALLGVPEDTLLLFPRELREGMTEPTRAELLGDTPAAWDWGFDADGARRIDAALLVYARDAADLGLAVDWLIASGNGAVEATRRLYGELGEDAREPFGFRDGISQPHFRHGNDEGQAVGLLRRDREANTINAGEVLLGYIDEFGARSPSAVVAEDPHRCLATGEHGLPDLGFNGSYLVVRQIEQHVGRFWRTLDVAQAAKIVGRWPGGASLVLEPNAENADVADTENDFGYRDQDSLGHGCPFGAHVRRANPRDTLDDGGSFPLGKDPFARATRISNRHRLVRRGRPYSDRQAKGEDRGRGLVFACCVASIRRQFEFVQRTWVNDPGFGGLRGEPDPLVGRKRTGEAPFTIQAPVPEPRLNLPDFVTVRGGAYFFMPSLRALRYLAG